MSRPTDRHAEDRPVLFLVYDRRDWESDHSNVVSVCGTFEEAAREQWPPSYAITRCQRQSKLIDGTYAYGNEVLVQ